MSQYFVRKVRTYLVMAGIVGFGLIMWLQQQSAKRAAETVREGPRPARNQPAAAREPAAGPETERTKALRAAQPADPESALKLAEEILAAPLSAGEAQVARELHPAVLEACFGWRLKNQRESDALALRSRLAELYPGSRQSQLVALQWGDHLAGRAEAALQINDLAAAEAALKALFADPEVAKRQRRVYERWQRHKLDAWRAARKDKAPGTDALLVDAAMILTTGDAGSALTTTILQSDLPPSDLVRLGDLAVQSGAPHAALALWQAALAGPNRVVVRSAADRRKAKGADLAEALKQDLRRRLLAGWQELAARLKSGERPAYVLVDFAAALIAAADVVSGRPEQIAVLVQLLEQQVAEVRAAAAGVTAVTFEQLGREDGLKPEEESRLTSVCRDLSEQLNGIAQRTGQRLWRACLANARFNPWPSIPADAQAALTEANVGGRWTETDKRHFLMRYYERTPSAIPLAELAPLANLLQAVHARWGMAYLRNWPATAFERLREVLRSARDDDLRAGVAAALRHRLAASCQKGDFDNYYLLAGFYASEVGLPAAGDAFREELRTGLRRAADSLKGRAPLKQIFMLSLLGEVFATEAAGKEAHDQAFELAFAAVAALPAETAQTWGIDPSGLPAHSLHCIVNSTPYHLLCFYRGPEQFTVHNWPISRGTVALANGDYELVVLCSDGSIQPFRGRIAMSSALRTSDYHVQKFGSFVQTGNEVDYRLLRAPPGLPDLVIDPRTGRPRAGRR